MLQGECEGCEELAYQYRKLVKKVIEIQIDGLPLREEDCVKLLHGEVAYVEVIYEAKSFMERLRFGLARATVEVPRFLATLLGKLARFLGQFVFGSTLVPLVMTQFLSARVIIKNLIPIVSLFFPFLGRMLEFLLFRLL